MPDASIINYQAFEPWNGGAGVRMTATSTTAAVPIPGLEGGASNDKSRVVVTNPNGFSVFIRMGGSSVVATLNSFEVIANSSQLLKPPNIGTQPVYMAAITVSASLPISICSGTGV
jgi:hypothetical protein